MQLNVDQHNRNIQDSKRMTLQDWSKNLRDLNDGGCFPIEFLSDIFNNIRHNEIVLPSERDGAIKEDYEWKVCRMICVCMQPLPEFMPLHRSAYFIFCLFGS